jgi:hypothetical protein
MWRKAGVIVAGTALAAAIGLTGAGGALGATPSLHV